MKNKIIKILERPKIVIPFVLIVSVAVGFFVYKNFGISPKVQISNQGNTDSSTSYIISSEFKDGEVVDLAFPKGGRVDKIYVKTGDKVKKGQLLANLDSTDVKGALEIAKANYTRIINGATGPDIDVAKAAVATAQTALDQIKIQQDLLVKNAYKNLLGTGLAAVSEDASSIETPPVISGTYSKEQEGKIILNIFHGGNGDYFNVSGVVSAVVGTVSVDTPQPIGDSGLFIKFSNQLHQANWVIDIPNKRAPQYLANFNAYQSAQTTRDQAIANATALLNQANSTLLQKQATARPEDVAAAEGAVKVAEGAYANDFIYAPADGVMTATNISTGEIALTNQKIISMIVKTSK